jgi:hypothetical protein
MQILIGHTSPETAYLVKDYPYGFRLRTEILYWLEESPTKGFRFCSQTKNPKTGRWNAPKKSTYCKLAGVMFLDDNGHTQWIGLGEYCDSKGIREYLSLYGAALSNQRKEFLAKFADKKEKVEQAFTSGALKWEIKSSGPAQITGND